MTNNHCPQSPAQIVEMSAKMKTAIYDFARKLENEISEFAEEFSIQEMLETDEQGMSALMECGFCESRILEIQAKAHSEVTEMIMDYLLDEFRP